jgi:hypothetical protein
MNFMDFKVTVEYICPNICTEEELGAQTPFELFRTLTDNFLIDPSLFADRYEVKEIKAMRDRHIILNRIQCNECREVLISHSRHEFVACRCFDDGQGGCAVDGGFDYLKRTGTNYTEMSVYSDASFETIREHLYRGSYGVDGQGPLRYTALRDMSDAHLSNVIRYNEHIGFGDGYITNFYRDEQRFRKEKNITIND